MSQYVVLQPLPLVMPKEEYNKVQRLYRPLSFSNTSDGFWAVCIFAVGIMGAIINFRNAFVALPDINTSAWIITALMLLISFAMLAVLVGSMLNAQKKIKELTVEKKILFALQSEIIRYNEVINSVPNIVCNGDAGKLFSQAQEKMILAWYHLLSSAIRDCQNGHFDLVSNKLAQSRTAVFNC